MRLITTYFGVAGGRFERLLKVFIYSALQQGYKPDVIMLDVPTSNLDRKQGVINNHYKLNSWKQYLLERQDGERVLFMDCDILLMDDPSVGFKDIIDIGYTVHRKQPPILNGGVVYVIKNSRTVAFFKRWAEIDRKMVRDEKFHKTYWSRYWGINQSSFGYMIENPEEHNVDLKEMPCTKYNVCDDDWRNPPHPERIAIHFKSELQRFTLSGKLTRKSNKRRRERIMLLRKIWLDAEKHADNIDINDFQYVLSKKPSYD